MQTERDLKELESEIRKAIRQFSSDNILLAIRNALSDLRKENSIGHRFFAKDQVDFPPFVAAGIAAFSIMHSNPNRDRPNVTWENLAKLAGMVRNYLLADPISFDETIREEFDASNPVFVMLRIVSSQFPFEVNLFGCHAQPLILFGKIAKEITSRKGVPEFDFDAEFQKVTGVSLEKFVDVGFVAWAATEGTNGFTRGYFRKAQDQGINVPDDETISQILEQVAADPVSFREEYEKRKERDRRFQMYDFNPLFSFPILRPWKYHNGIQIDRDRMVAPIPDLVAYRFSTGIFYQMFNACGVRFSDYFGHLFEAYVGEILKQSVSNGTLVSEEDIRLTYPEKNRRVPDWIVIDGATAILIECKATRFSRAASATGAETAINDSLKQVLKGLRQLDEFRQALQARAPGLEMLHRCTTFKPILVSFEPLYLVDSPLFRQHIDHLLAAEGVTGLPWRILSLKELEAFQPHMSAGVRLAEITQGMENGTFSLEKVSALTGRTYKDSFLYKSDEEMYRRLGIAGR
jgi:hypothetical protein